MKTIFIYGDSNAYGLKAWPLLPEPRYERDNRWPGIVQRDLGDEVEVIVSGLPGRMAGNIESSENEFRNGQDQFLSVLLSHTPIDTVIIALGTNDLKKAFNRSAKDIYEDLLWYQGQSSLCNDARQPVAPKFVYVVPPAVAVASTDNYFGGQESLREKLAQLMKQSPEMECVDLGEVTLNADGVHFSTIGHRQAAEIITSKLKEMGL